MIANINEPKRAAAQFAAALIENNMIVGLGTGSTASYFIESLIQRTKEGLKITGVATSASSSMMAEAGGIPLIDINEAPHIDITVDGADEIDPHKRAIKGGGGALLREKIVASISKELIIIVDETKLVQRLGNFPLPVEIVPFGYKKTEEALNSLGYPTSMRRAHNGPLFITENHNYIVDLHFGGLLDTPEKDHDRIINIVGVVETGFFLNLIDKVIIGKSKGKIEIHS